MKKIIKDISPQSLVRVRAIIGLLKSGKPVSFHKNLAKAFYKSKSVNHFNRLILNLYDGRNLNHFKALIDNI